MEQDDIKALLEEKDARIQLLEDTLIRAEKRCDKLLDEVFSLQNALESRL